MVRKKKKKKHPKNMTSRHRGMLSPPWDARRGITQSVYVAQVWGKCYDFCVAFQESVREEHPSGCLEEGGGPMKTLQEVHPWQGGQGIASQAATTV